MGTGTDLGFQKQQVWILAQSRNELNRFSDSNPDLLGSYQDMLLTLPHRAAILAQSG